MDEVDADEGGVPQEGVQEAHDGPSPDREEGAADEKRAPQVQDSVRAVGGEVRQEEEGVGELEVHVVDGRPLGTVRHAEDGGEQRHAVRGVVGPVCGCQGRLHAASHSHGGCREVVREAGQGARQGHRSLYITPRPPWTSARTQLTHSARCACGDT